MTEAMTQTKELDPMKVTVKLLNRAVKGESAVSKGALEVQGDKAKRHLHPVDYAKVRGTCSDERPRVGLRNGEQKVEPRPSVYGGPVIHGLAVAELSGVFRGQTSTGRERLRQTIKVLKANDLPIGAHEHCAANAGFGQWMQLIGEENKAAIKDYAKEHLGDNYDDAMMDEVFVNAAETNKSGTYDEWSESVLFEEFGDEAGEAIERLADVPHEAKSMLRTDIAGWTVDQTELHDDGGDDSFVYDDPYADAIENAVASGPEAAKQLNVMRHAREAIIWAIDQAVPNPELHEIHLTV